MDISYLFNNKSEPTIENNSFLNHTSTEKLFEENYKKDLILDNKNFDIISNDSFNSLQIPDIPIHNNESLNTLISHNSNSKYFEKNSDMKDDSTAKDKKSKNDVQQKLYLNKLSARKSRQKRKNIK